MTVRLVCEIAECLGDAASVVTTRGESYRTGLHDVRLCETHLQQLITRVVDGLYRPGDGETYRIWWRRV